MRDARAKTIIRSNHMNVSKEQASSCCWYVSAEFIQFVRIDVDFRFDIHVVMNWMYRLETRLARTFAHQ